ncbi:MAG: hypothetical protein GWN01_13515 [Nitrosopumilaceae archaeon]|nr:hypothetical protein [Nitrosopumilaceae archaeon]NIU01882.1 hypothetical protein [Nitrosopumilaceae archaeon]NIU88286.1 hypothetical protein [Nitrosopumilaceae archaeon]NIV66578.1 hypothetical protein [Nitrosopumilaceae archaeon]NIX62483.1 hypothetical protein [Nitrosopumilaceae archaeon]
MTQHAFRFNLEGGKSLELNLSEKEFEKLSDLCEKEFPEKKWKTHTIKQKA